MKRLLCGLETDKESLIKHYIIFHKVDPQNYFFKYLFLVDNETICNECCRCGEFIATKLHQRHHNFLPFEEKPIAIKNIRDLTSYEISVEKHGEYYNFSEPDTIIEEFLQNGKLRFKPIGEDVSIKCGFSIQNIQPAPTTYTVTMTNARYWSTDIYRTTYFNEHVLFSLKDDIKKRVIVNGLSGSSWHFNKFLYLNLKVFKGSSNLKI